MQTAYDLIANELVDQLSPGGVLRFSDRMGEVYQQQMDAFSSDPATSGWRSRCPGLHPGSIRDETDIAAEMALWFPTHFYKIQRVLIRDLLQNTSQTDGYPFGTSNITIVDIGAGVGTASLALVDTIALWQEAAMKLGYPPLKARVRVLPVESNEKKTDVRNVLFGLLEKRLRPELIHVEHLPPLEKDYVEDEQCADDIVNMLGSDYLAICVFSNILNWIKDVKWHVRLLRKFGIARSSTPPHLVSTVKLLNDLNFCRTIVLSSETKTPELGKQQQILIDEIRRGANVDGRLDTGSIRDHIQYSNPPQSYYSWKPAYSVDFHSAVVSLDRGCGNPRLSHCRDSTLHRSLDRRQLRLQWSKARYEVHRNPIVDEVHCKLLETDLDWHLERLARSLACGSSDHWFQMPTGFYLQPKPGGGSRVTSICSIADAVVAVSLMWGIRGNAKRILHGSSHAYRLEIDESEFLYEYFGDAYRRYIISSLIALNHTGGHYRTLDVRGFYSNIGQQQLKEIFEVSGYASKPCQSLLARWNSHVMRAILGWRSGCGLPIGHPISGLMSNIYLHRIDLSATTEASKSGATYCRYVDDICIVAKSEADTEQLRDHVRSEIDAFKPKLELNPGKETYGQLNEYLVKNFDNDLQVMSQRVAGLLRPVYALPILWRLRYDISSCEFCQWYSERLADLGIHISVRHLRRKLGSQKQHPLAKHYLQIHFANSLNWSSVGRPLGTPATGWLTGFRNANRLWWDAKTMVSEDCYDLAVDSLGQLSGGGLSAEQAKIIGRKLRFAAYRLALFEHAGSSHLLGRLLRAPYLVSPYLVAMGLANYNNRASLRAGLKSKCQLTRLSCIRFLGELRDVSSIPTLWALTESGSAQVVRLCATEALLRIGHFDQASMYNLMQRARIEKDPYVAKNYILALGLTRPRGWDYLAEQIVQDTDHQVTLDALVWANSGSGVTDILRRPDVPPPHYSKRYPETEWSDLQDGSPSA